MVQTADGRSAFPADRTPVVIYRKAPEERSSGAFILFLRRWVGPFFTRWFTTFLLLPSSFSHRPVRPPIP